MTIGLVLSGGGIRGVAHIGVLKALNEHHVFPTHIAGSSAGAVVGALYAYGYNFEAILGFFKSIQLLDISKYALNKPGLINAEKFYDQFKSYFINDDFSALKGQLYITATNILSGEPEVFSKGELIKPLIASSAVPGFFAPVQINGNYFVDGGVLNNFPVELLKGKCDFIIGVYVNGYETINIKDLKYSHNVVERAFKLKTVKEDFEKFKDCDLVIYPKNLCNYGTFDKKHIDAIFKMGYQSAMSELKGKPLKKLKPRKMIGVLPQKFG